MDSLATKAASALMSCASLWLILTSLAPAQATEKAAATVRHVAVLGAGNSVEVEIMTSQPMTPATQVVTGPDRLVIDFPNATPGSGLHNLAIDRGAVKGIRVGLFSANPPVTRVVVDLKTQQPFQVFTSGKTVMVKLAAGGTRPRPSVSQAAIISPPQLPPPQPARPPSKLEVGFKNGKLSIWSNKATLAEVLNEIHRRTGANIPIPPGAQQEQVVANFGPAPAREVLAALLNGSRFNFVLVGSDRNSTDLRSVLLTLRGEAMPQAAVYTPPPTQTPVAQFVPEQEPPPQNDPPPPQNDPPAQMQPEQPEPQEVPPQF
jgi:hypothetical protein